MSIQTKYVNGMHEIKATDELKLNIMYNTSKGAGNFHTKRLVFRNRFAIIVSFCTIIVLLTLGGMNIFQLGNEQDRSSIFDGFVISVYATDGSLVEVKPNVDFPLHQYTSLMSSVPGLPVTIASEDADIIKLKYTDGQLLLWNRAESQITYLNNGATVKPGETIYWSPLLKDASQQPAATNAEIEITAFKDKIKLGSNTIEITLGKDNLYTGVLKE